MRAVKTVDFQDAMNRVASHDHGDQASKENPVSTTDPLDLFRRAVDEIASANGVSNKMNYRHVDTGGTW